MCNVVSHKNVNCDQVLLLHNIWWGHKLLTGIEGGGKGKTTTPPVVIRNDHL